MVKSATARKRKRMFTNYSCKIEKNVAQGVERLLKRFSKNNVTESADRRKKGATFTLLHANAVAIGDNLPGRTTRNLVRSDRTIAAF